MACEASGGLLELGHDREPDRALGDPDHEHPQGLVWVVGPSCSGGPSSSNIARELREDVWPLDAVVPAHHIQHFSHHHEVLVERGLDVTIARA